MKLTENESKKTIRFVRIPYNRLEVRTYKVIDGQSNETQLSLPELLTKAMVGAVIKSVKQGAGGDVFMDIEFNEGLKTGGVMAKKIIGADDVINQISETLVRTSGEYIEKMANEILRNKVEYKGDSLFEQDES